MQGDAAGNFICRNSEGTVCKKWAASEISVSGQVGYVLQIETRLGIAKVQVFRGQQAVSLGPHISHRQHQVFANLTLDSQVVLRCVLGTEVGLQFSKQQNGTE